LPGIRVGSKRVSYLLVACLLLSVNATSRLSSNANFFIATPYGCWGNFIKSRYSNETLKPRNALWLLHELRKSAVCTLFRAFWAPCVGMVEMIDVCADLDPEEGNGNFLRNVGNCFTILIRCYIHKNGSFSKCYLGSSPMGSCSFTMAKSLTCCLFSF
jgi:hypothetical protein